jgi:hypothetical protein
MTHDIFIVNKQFRYLCTDYLKNIRVNKGAFACVPVLVCGGVLNDVIYMKKNHVLFCTITWKAD